MGYLVSQHLNFDTVGEPETLKDDYKLYMAASGISDNREGAKNSGGKIAGLVPATGEHR